MADSKPHVHEPVLKESFCPAAPNDHVLTYGDTTVRICSGWRKPSQRVIDKALVKAIKQHDAGPVPASTLLGRFQNAATSGKWGTDILKELTI